MPQQADRGAGRSRMRPFGWITRSAFISDLRIVLAERNFRRLFSVRLISQTGDGIVTAGIGTYVFFNAETFTSPAAAAVAFTVLYLPYSLIGPFAGVFIDRWSRRQILVLSALLRSAFVVLTAVLMASGNRSVPLYAAYLLVLGVNRFFLASLSAALPHVVPADKLVMANSVSPTAGGIMALIGGLVAGGLNAATGDTERGAAITMLVAGGCYVAASLVAATMRRDLLGPVREPGAPPGRLLSDLASVTAELAAGARYALRRRGPATALGATGGSKFLYGILFVMSILLYRNYFYPSSAPVAEGHYLVLASVSAIGYFCAALVVPPADQAADQAGHHHAAARRLRGGDRRARRDLRPARVPGFRVLPVPDLAGRGDLRDHDPAGGRGGHLPRAGVRLLRHDVQRHDRRRGADQRGLHAAHRQVTRDHRRWSPPAYAVVAAGYWLLHPSALRLAASRGGRALRPRPSRSSS